MSKREQKDVYMCVFPLPVSMTQMMFFVMLSSTISAWYDRSRTCPWLDNDVVFAPYSIASIEELMISH